MVGVKRVFVLAGVLTAAALASSCGSGGGVSGQAADPYRATLAHADTVLHEIGDGLAASMKIGDVDYNSGSASATVNAAFAKAVTRNRGIDRALADMKADAARAKGEQAKELVPLVDEFEGLVSAHQEADEAFWAFSRQLIATGIAEVEGPPTENDLAGCLTLAELLQSGRSVAVVGGSLQEMAGAAAKNNTLLRDMFKQAHELEPAAGLDAAARFHDEELKVCELLLRAADAMDRGRDADASELIKEAVRVHEQNHSQQIELAIFGEGYNDRAASLGQHRNDHIARAKAMLDELRGPGD